MSTVPDLQSAIRLVETLLRRTQDKALDVLINDYGADKRFRGGTDELRFVGALGTCTAGGVGLVQSWLRAAQRKLERENA